jgi:hypothetical protein
VRPRQGKEKQPLAANFTARAGETPALDLHCKASIVAVDLLGHGWRDTFARFLGFASGMRCVFHSCFRVASARLYVLVHMRHADPTAAASRL